MRGSRARARIICAGFAEQREWGLRDGAARHYYGRSDHAGDQACALPDKIVNPSKII